MRINWWRVLGVFLMILSGLVVIGLLAAISRAETICVEPIVPGTTQQERQPLKAQVEEMVQKKGLQTGCPGEFELLVEPLSGRAYSEQIYFVAQVSNGVGTVSLRQPSAGFNSWIVGIHPSGQALAGEQTLGYSLRGGVHKMLRKVNRHGGK